MLKVRAFYWDKFIMQKKINRRNFLKSSALVGASAALFSSKTIGSISSDKKLRLGVIGTGLRGQWMIHLSLQRKDVDVRAICERKARNDALATQKNVASQGDVPSES